MRNIQSLLFITSLMLTCLIPNATAHEYYKIKLRIQIVEGITLDDETINFNLEDVNAIFEQCNIRFNVIEIERDVIGNASTLEARMDLRQKMRDGLKEHPFNSSGAGVTVTGPLNNDSNKHGETGVGDPTSVIVTSEEDGETWAHEIAHGLGLSHNGNDTDGNGAEDSWDPDLDGKTNTANDYDNLQWPGRDTRQGNQLNEAQCKILQDNAKKIGKTVLNDEQTKTSLDGDSYIEKTYDYAYDDLGEAGIVRDLHYASLFSIEPFETLTIEWTTDVIPSSEILDMDYIFALNTDNNESSGTTIGNGLGMDFVFDVWLEGGTLQTSNKWPTYYNYLTDEGGDITGDIEFGNITLDASTYNISDEIIVTPISTYFSLTINRTLLGVLDSNVPSIMMVAASGQEDFVNITFRSEPDIESRISSPKLVTWVGDTLQLTGTNFAPDTIATVWINDENVSRIDTDEIGGFSITVVIPDLPLGTYYLEVIDAESNLSFLILEIADDPNPQDTSDPLTTTNNVSNSSSPSIILSSDPLPMKYTIWLFLLPFLALTRRLITFKTQNLSKRKV